MSDDLKFQLRLTLSDEFAQVARNVPGDPSISTLTDILNRHDAVMKCQFDAFADYVSEAEANGIEILIFMNGRKKLSTVKIHQVFRALCQGRRSLRKGQSGRARGRAEASSWRSHRREDVQIQY
jgi:hypothetical protein